MNKKQIFLWGTLSTGLLACLLGGYFLFFVPSAGIYSFVESRDSAFIYEIFEKNWPSLVPGRGDVCDKTYVDFFIKNHCTRTRPAYLGKMIIKIYYDHGVPAGFVTYYKQDLNTGFILFVGVKEEFRSKHVGRKLVDYACKKLKEMGCTKVEMTTSQINIPAQTLYLHSGFRKLHENPSTVEFRKILV